MNSWETSVHTGGTYEGELFPEFFCGWKDQEFIELRKNGEHAKAKNLLNNWLSENLSLEDSQRWPRASAEEQKNILIAWAEKHQPENWDPENPTFTEERDGQVIKRNLTAGNLLYFVAENLSPNDYSAVKFYNSARTPLDTLHGTDGFFDYRGFVFTIDVTNNPNKNASKADYILRLNNMGDEKELEERGADIAKWIKKYYEQREKEKLGKRVA